MGESKVPALFAGHALVHLPHEVQESKANLCRQLKSDIDAAPILTSKLPDAKSSLRSNGVLSCPSGL